MIRAELRKKLMTDLGISIESVLIPKNSIDLYKWAVVACDQYTSQPEYWKDVEDITNSSPSTLNLIFPEVFLERETEAEKQQRIDGINKAMATYLEQDIMEELTDSLVLVERTFESGKTRNGLMLSLDLERYDFKKGSQSLIRATEGTILERLPPRIKIREKAQLELPHIMVLIDDKEKSVIEPLMEKVSAIKEVYSGNLMKNGGSIKGWQVDDEAMIQGVYEAFSKLADPKGFNERYQLTGNQNVLLFAVGDGNHSLATAKACWEALKANLSEEEQKNHPARFALVEIVNLHDPGLEFEPIHRVLFNVDPDTFFEAFMSYFGQKGCKAYVASGQPDTQNKCHCIEFVSEHKTGSLVVECPQQNLDVGTLQSFLDEYLKAHPESGIDYVHGDAVTRDLGSRKGNMGFLLSVLDKNELFKTVILDGALPRKTFSMGEAEEKRYYLEARKIR